VKMVRRRPAGNGRNLKLVTHAVCAFLLMLCVSAQAQQITKVPRIGFLAGSAPDAEKARLASFQQGLQDLGYIEGKTILIEQRYAEGKLGRIPVLAAELVHLNVDIIVVTYLPAIRAVKAATKTIPIVMVSFVDPVAGGLIDSLAHPGGNITGIATLRHDLSGKRLELLKEVVPAIARVGILWNSDGSGPIAFKEYEPAARSLNIQIQSIAVGGLKPDLDGAAQDVAKRRTNALIIVTNSVFNRYRERVTEIATNNRLPSMCEGGEMVNAGGLMSYSASEPDQFRRAAIYVDKILKGAKPADLPVEQPTKFDLVINLKAAKQIGLTIPPNVLARADRVIR
jgi:putative ABC transport system substrate-binding protein